MYATSLFIMHWLIGICKHNKRNIAYANVSHTNNSPCLAIIRNWPRKAWKKKRKRKSIHNSIHVFSSGAESGDVHVTAYSGQSHRNTGQRPQGETGKTAWISSSSSCPRSWGPDGCRWARPSAPCQCFLWSVHCCGTPAGRRWSLERRPG